MPLLGRTPFQRQKIPADLKESDEVFVCKATGEVFTDYEKFFDQIILCNSLIWTCAATGHGNLTFQEALDSEKKSRELLATFPDNMRRPVLYFASRTRRTIFKDFIDDIFGYIKERYFIGEKVSIVTSGEKKIGVVMKVLLPGNAEVNGDDFKDEKKKSNSRKKSVDPNDFQYTIQEKNSNKLYVLEAKNVSRPKGSFTRDKCKLFLKEHCEHKGNGVWKVKESSAKKFKLNTAEFVDFFEGPPPVFYVCSSEKDPAEQSDSSDSENEKKSKHKEDASPSKGDKKKQPNEKDSPRKKSPNNEAKQRDRQLAEKLKKKEEQKVQAEKERNKKEELAKKKEEEKNKMELLKVWQKPRDDMQCDDLHDLPLATPVRCLPSADGFSQVVMALEFLLCFKPFCSLDLPELSLADNEGTCSAGSVCSKVISDIPLHCSSDKIHRPLSLQFLSMHKFLTDLVSSVLNSDVDGLFSDMLRQLLIAVFHLQNEADQEADNELLGQAGYGNEESSLLVNFFKSVSTSVKSPVQSNGTPLRKLPLDAWSLTEVVRLHLQFGLQSHNNFDCHQLSPSECTNLDFCRRYPDIVQKLAKQNILDLSPGEKLNILSALIDQILSFATTRDFIEDNLQKLKNAQKDLKLHLWSVQRRERDEQTYSMKKKMEEKAKESSQESNASDPKNNTESKSGAVVSKPETRKTKKNSILNLKDKDFEEMPVENLDWDQITAEERECIKQWSRRKEKQLVELSEQLQYASAIFPLGLDRTFRRYWVFRSVPGLFVEDDDENVIDELLVPVSQDASKISSIKQETTSDLSNVETDTFKSCDEKSVSKYSSVQEQIACRGRVKWAFYGNVVELDSLIKSLNSRGFREGALKTALIQRRDHLESWVRSCDVNLLSGMKLEKNESDDVMTSADGHLEKTLCEMILDLEDRIFVGSLGSLKSADRKKWRLALENFPTSLEPFSQHVDLGENGCDNSAPSCENESMETPEICEQDNVKCLIKALLDVQEMVDIKYLNPPLGDDEETKRLKLKVTLESAAVDKHDENSNASSSLDSSKSKNDLERWRQCLRSATSLSQVYLYLYVLDSNIAWSKSALNARCQICRRKTDGEHMLLCDGCDRGHHLYCLKPPLKRIPDGDWYCPSCRPKDLIRLAPASPRKKSTTQLDSDSMSSESESGSSSEDEGTENQSISVRSHVNEEASSSGDDESVAEDDDDSNSDWSESTTPSVKVNPKVEKKQSNYDQNSNHGSEKVVKVKSSRLSEKHDVVANKSGRGHTGDTSRRSLQLPVKETGVGIAERVKRTRVSLGSDVNVRKRKAPSYFDDDGVAKRMYVPTKSTFRSSQNSLKTCEDLVTELMKKDEAWPFLKPVTVKEAPDYFTIVKRPMDLSTIKYKIYQFIYTSGEQIIDDLRLMFSNCSLYNKASSPVYVAGQMLEDYFETRLRELDCSPKPECSSNSKHSRDRKRTM